MGALYPAAGNDIQTDVVARDNTHDVHRPPDSPKRREINKHRGVVFGINDKPEGDRLTFDLVAGVVTDDSITLNGEGIAGCSEGL